jgi:hypothetical protein
MRAVLSAGFLLLASASDPAGSWLTYAVYRDASEGRITALNTTWTVPSEPSTPYGSNAPGWWFGTQTSRGDGALVQPILAYGYQGNFYSIFNGVFDWTDGSWHTSDESVTVQPGDKIMSSVTTSDNGASYDMYIASTQTGKSISTNYRILSGQTATESVAYFVLEHQPQTCAAYPSNGACLFENIYLEVDGKEVQSPAWEAKLEQPACNSKTTIVDPQTIKFTWDASSEAPTSGLASSKAPLKWLDLARAAEKPTVSV